MSRLTFTTVLFVLTTVVAASPQRASAQRLSDVFVYPIQGLSGEPFPGVKVELLNSSSTVVASGVSTVELPVVELKGLLRTAYTLRLIDPDPNAGTRPVTRSIQLFRPEHWFTQTLLPDLQGYVYLPPEEQAVAKNLLTFQGRVTPMKPEAKRPMWARMTGVLSDSTMDSRIKPDGSFEFQIQPGPYVLIVVQGTKVCAMQQVESFRPIREGPLRVTLSPTCRR